MKNKRILKATFLFFISWISLTSFIFGQDLQIKGKVTDATTSEVLPGVTVQIKGTSRGTISSVDGTYSIICSQGSILVFSYLGYKNQEITVNDAQEINLTLSQDVTGLDEVVVIGYGTTKKRDLTGSLSTVKADDMNKSAASTPEQLLQGKVSGVQIVSNNGEPGAGSQIRIRGASTIRAGQQPLYVVDGIPLDETTTSPDGISGNALGGSPATSPLTSINPNDIESIDILKDASAAAIYGSRGANGVILITTKKGKEGSSEVSYSTTFSISQLPKKLDVLSGNAWAAFRKDSLKTTDYNFRANTDWQDQIFRTAYSNDHNLSLSGGNAKTTYRASMNYANQQGIIKTSDLTRYNGRLSLSQKTLNDKLLFELNLNGSQVVENRVPVGATGFEGDLLLNALQANPTWPVYDSIGKPFQGNKNYTFTSSDRNPVAMLQYTSDVTRTSSLLGGIASTLDILPGLKYKINLGMDYTNANRFINQSQRLSYMINTLGSGQINNKELYNYIIEHTLDFNKTFGVHTIDLLAGYSYQDFNVRGNNTTAGGYATDGILYTNTIGSGTPTYTSLSSYFDNYKMQSFFGRINYNFSEKYLITATVRTDGSTKFGVNKKYGTFPSFAAGWRMSEEDFIKSTGIFSNLKFRIGWGQTGNSEIPTKRSQYLYTPDNGSKAIVGGQTIIGLKIDQTPDYDLTWETTTSSNLGLDFGILKGRLSGTVDLYQKTTTNLLLNTPTPPGSPTSEYIKNLDGVKIANKGIEFSLAGVAIDNKDFTWNISGIISFLNNNVSGLPQIYPTGSAQGQGLTGAYVQVIANNQPMNVFYGRKIDSLDKKGNVYYLKSKVKKGVDSLTYLGNPQPKYTWSLTNSFRYKYFDLNIFIEGVQGNKIFNNTALLLDKTNLNQAKNTLNYLLNDNVNFSYTPNVSDRYVEDGSYVRLSNITLGFNAPIKTNTGIKKVRVYISGSNLAVFTKYKGYDPDVSSSKDMNGINSFGIDITNYPKSRTYLMGLNVTF